MGGHLLNIYPQIVKLSRPHCRHKLLCSNCQGHIVKAVLKSFLTELLFVRVQVMAQVWLSLFPPFPGNKKTIKLNNNVQVKKEVVPMKFPKRELTVHNSRQHVANNQTIQPFPQNVRSKVFLDQNGLRNLERKSAQVIVNN